jgi:hypothetical protein
VKGASGGVIGVGESMAVNANDCIALCIVSLSLAVSRATHSEMPLTRRSRRSQLPAKCHERATTFAQLYAYLPGHQTARSAHQRREPHLSHPEVFVECSDPPSMLGPYGRTSLTPPRRACAESPPNHPHLPYRPRELPESRDGRCYCCRVPHCTGFSGRMRIFSSARQVSGK